MTPDTWPANAHLAWQRIASPALARQAWLTTERQTYRFADLDLRIRQIAGLRRELGLATGDRVLLGSRDDAELALLFVAAVCNGLTAAMIDADTGAERAASLIRNADPRLCLVDSALAARWLPDGPQDRLLIEITPEPPAAGLDRLMRRAPPRGGLHARLAGVPPAEPPADLPPETLAYLLFTSGTTDQPKGVAISHRALFAHLATLARRYGYTPGSRILNPLMLSHTDGIIQGPAMAFFAGIGVWRPMRFEVGRIEALLDAIYRLRITHFVTVPTMMALLLRLGLERRDAFQGGDFRLLISCGAQLEARLCEDFESAFQVPIINVYGLTETVTGGVFSGPDAPSRKPGSIGLPEDCKLRIADAEGRPCADGETGELLMRGALLMSGYHGQPEATAAVLRDGWFHTGDLARRDPQGHYWILGRSKNLILRGSYSIHPEEVTEALQRHPAVHEAATFGIPDPVWGETVGCLVVAAAGTAEETLRAHCEALLEPHKRPGHLHLVEALPRGRSGKLLQADARQQLLDAIAGARAAPARTAAAVADSRDLTDRLLAVAAASFRVPAGRLALHLGPEQLPGWDSLAHMEFVVALETEFGVQLSPRDILDITRLDQALEKVRGGV